MIMGQGCERIEQIYTDFIDFLVADKVKISNPSYPCTSVSGAFSQAG